MFLWNDVKDKLQAKATLADARAAAEAVHRAAVAAQAAGDPDGRALLGARRRGHRSAIETLIDALREKYTIVIVTHNMAQARRASDECIYMLLGE